jgi:heavy metal sensor kinase
VPGSESLLIAAYRVPEPGGGSLLVEVGTSAAPVDTLLGHLLLLLSLGLPIVVAVAAGGGYLLVKSALRPVDEMARKAGVITQHNLSERLPVSHTGDELERLSIALNRMILRLDDAFRNSRRFLADASHELRTPLTILRGELESLVQGGAVAAGERERLGSLLEEVERLTKIVERLFALSRLDAGDAQVEWVQFDLAELVATTTDQMKLMAEDRRIAVACDVMAATFVCGDHARMKQVVVNLLDNAIKYTPEGGAVSLSVHSTADAAILEVADTGVGIPPGDLQRVFDRFFRADSTRALHPDGAGLGLAIVKSICNAHGGSVEAESSPGRGTRFTVTLPLAQPDPPA